MIDDKVLLEDPNEFDLPDDEPQEIPTSDDDAPESFDLDQEPETNESDEFDLEDEDLEGEEEEDVGEEEEEGEEGEFDLDSAEDEEEAEDDSEGYGDDSEPEGEESEIQKLENEIFKDLSKSQKNSRDKELLSLYVETYNSLSSILLRIEKIVKTDQNLKVLKFVTIKTVELRKVLYDYMSDTFSNNTYVENLTYHYEVLSIINSLKKMLNELKKDKEKQQNV